MFKKRLAALGIVALIATGCGSAIGPASSLPPHPVPIFPASYVSMTANGTGWALRLGQVSVFHTTDGTTWTNVTPPAVPHGAPAIMYALSGTQAWVAYSGSNDIVVLRTTDAGSSWTRSTMAWHPPPMLGRLLGPSSMEFVTASTGWLCVEVGAGFQSAGMLYRTENGGATWEMVSASRSFQPGALPFDATELAFTSPQSGWITGGFFTTTGNELFRTTDSGRQWKQVNYPVPASESSQVRFGARIASLWPRGSTAMMVVTFSNRSYLYATSDAGAHWTYTPLSGGFWTADLLAGGTIIAASGTTTYSFTAAHPSRARTSTVASSAATRMVFELDFITPEHGWAIVAEGDLSQSTLYMTTDGGTRWSSSGFKVAGP